VIESLNEGVPLLKKIAEPVMDDFYAVEGFPAIEAL
jgi:hypothetical protein